MAWRRSRARERASISHFAAAAAAATAAAAAAAAAIDRGSSLRSGMRIMKPRTRAPPRTSPETAYQTHARAYSRSPPFPVPARLLALAPRYSPPNDHLSLCV